MKRTSFITLAFVALALVFAMPVMADAGFIHLATLDPHTLALGSALLMLGKIDLKELRDQRGKLVHDARQIVDKAEAEKRALTAEEDGQFKELVGKQEELRAKIEREEKLAEAERQTAEAELRSRDAAGGKGASGEEGEQRTFGKRGAPEYNSAFRKFLAGGRGVLTDGEIRALQADSDPAGGYMVAPEQFVDTLIKFVDNAVFIRARATKFRVETAASMGAASLDADPADADWTSEIATGSEDSTMAFGKRELQPRPLAKRIKISKKLLRQVASAEGLVNARLGYKFGVTQEKAFMTGSGANQPLGIFTASANGISTGRDVATGNAATAPTFDGLISAKYALKGQYWAKAEWVFHRDVMAIIAKLKDGDGQYLWRESTRAGEPDRLLNLPFNMSEYAPNTLTTGLYVGVLGDFSNYWICDALDMQVQRLEELYAETNQTGFIGRLETDGMPVLEEAFVRVKLG